METRFVRSIVIAITALSLGCVAAGPGTAQDWKQSLLAGERWGPFRGQFVDAETGKPLPGVAVLLTWWKEVPVIVQINTEFYDAREAVSDANGRFEVPRLTPPFFSSRIRQPQIRYFLAGYRAVSEVVTPPDAQPFAAPTVVRMRHLQTTKERLENQRRFPPPIPAEKMPRFLETLNEERRQLGLAPIRRGM
ncbi:MAG: hypothetical protein A3E31_04930 [Candidatus Rokubacteria bacterium RIFCSPHIGHO2_12_FULL_73_22]|nr:MAG: hypothetical protein A3D33_00635 [Candidatus Rokubacteria bacterium RIFCSPHIGHO2_02_FULL_73_26]OGL02332.1 MAG: hypothetical protein A3E31_04930 [Candidatus Rokubacteria bacterium RIFCSPHIGHO2_12_FULL_73_22]OGL09444.1 MAG: hypothetical protein A3I14_08975 [Candidatus Rokubacteria bacterium RIFCSPLOWO2_02_FULL_73_56]OGL25167.1 MAG: hypothetical protein A3G44_05640 [Candidatus Rokubacteria bacterium RIFCSPLOWO2_12_FULL_73_47]